jgi:hypothetical protein
MAEPVGPDRIAETLVSRVNPEVPHLFRLHGGGAGVQVVDSAGGRIGVES